MIHGGPILRSGYLFCSPSCLCARCLWADEWIRLLQDYPYLRVYRDDTPEIPGPAEFRVTGVRGDIA